MKVETKIYFRKNCYQINIGINNNKNHSLKMNKILKLEKKQTLLLLFENLYDMHLPIFDYMFVIIIRLLYIFIIVLSSKSSLIYVILIILFNI